MGRVRPAGRGRWSRAVGLGVVVAPLKRERLQFYRVWCGRKCYTAWLPDRTDAYAQAVAHGLAFDTDGVIALGPLTWIEVGERTYARSRTVPVPRRPSSR